MWLYGAVDLLTKDELIGEYKEVKVKTAQKFAVFKRCVVVFEGSGG